jgi:hypothetical protein
MRRSLCGLGGWLVGMLGVTEPVWACAVCGFGQGDRALAYVTAGWIMNAVPLVLIGGVAWYLWRQACASPPGCTVRQEVRPTVQDAAPTVAPCVTTGVVRAIMSKSNNA